MSSIWTNFHPKPLDLLLNFSYLVKAMEENQEKPNVQPTPETPSQEPQPPAVPTATGKEADLGARIGAAVIDFLVAAALSWAGSIVNSSLGMLAYVAYMLTRDALPFLEGQSIGKKAVGLKAVTEDGASLSGNWNPGLLRNIPMAIFPLPLVELIIMLVNKDKPEGLRRLGDQWAKTKVVTAKS